MMNVKIPQPNDPCLDKLLDKIDAQYEPQLLKVTPTKASEINECFVNVQNKVRQYGGQVILGYQIWKYDFFIEAEVHAVWEDRKGNLHDITPKSRKFNSILFVADDRINYVGKQINSVRLNISGNDIVDYLIDLYDIYFLILNKGERATQHALLIFNLEESKDLDSIQSFAKELSKMVVGCQEIHSTCFCGEPKTLEACHGKLIRELKHKYA